MQVYRFDIPEYDSAFSDLASTVVDGFIALDPLLGSMERRPGRHTGPIRNVPGPKPVDHPLTISESSVPVDKSAIRETNFEELATSLFSMAHQVIDQIITGLFQTMDDVTNATGNVLDAGGRPFTWDMYLDMLERVEIDFDADGKPEMPTFVGNKAMIQSVRAAERTPEHTERLNQIMARKKAEFNAKKRSRRLSR